MTSNKTQSVDYAKSLALLWGSQNQPGRSGLTLKAIVAAAINIADQEGVDALTMRKVAEQLGVGTMTLYSHVPGKEELLELMVDTVYAELYDHVEAPVQQGDWRAALRFVARQNWELYRRHPWMLPLAGGRPNLGPHALLKYEAELRPLDGLGLSDVEIDATLTLVISHVEGCARVAAAVERTQQETGMSEAEWWVNAEPVLAKVIDAARFPMATRVGSATGEAFQAASNPEFALDFGLERILSGVEELIKKNGVTSALRPKPTT